MKVLIDINHPAHVHLFKNVIKELQQAGHRTKITSREKDITIELLDRYGFDHVILSKKREGIGGLAVEYATRIKGIYQAVKAFNPDVLIGLNPAIAHVSAITDCQSIILHDTEPATLKENMFSPFADLILTPDCFGKDLGKNHQRYDGYHELAYLHPDRFDPDSSVFDSLPVGKDDKFALIRLVSWSASHDIGDSGIGDIKKVVDKLERLGVEILISSEDKLPPNLESYQVSLDPTNIHDVLYYTNVFLGESATMATESAVLGTPAVFVSTSTRGYIEDLSEYGLVFRYSGEDRTRRGLQQTIELIDRDTNWKQKRSHLLEKKGDTTDILLEYIENIHKNNL